jgi:hypothetical protein
LSLTYERYFDIHYDDDNAGFARRIPFLDTVHQPPKSEITHILQLCRTNDL